MFYIPLLTADVESPPDNASGADPSDCGAIVSDAPSKPTQIGQNE